MELAQKYDFLEVQPHNHPDQIAFNERLSKLSKKIGTPLIAGTDTHSSSKYKAECRAVLLSAKHKSYGDEDAFGLSYKTYDELVEMFRIQDALSKEDYMKAIENTNLLYDMTEEIELDTSIKYPILYGSRDSGVKRNESDLIGEIAPELWVHADTGTWELVDRPQFRKVHKGDVIFDARQTEDLLKNGVIDSFGNAFLSGTAYKVGVGGGGHSISSKPSSKSSSSKSSSSKNSKSSSDKDDELKVFDWIEIAIDRIERSVDRLKTTATSTYKALKTKLGATSDEISKVNQEILLQEKAYNRYIKQANSVGLSSGLASKVRNGTIDINEYSSETQELINDYQNWYEKAIACSDAVQKLHETLACIRT